MVIIMGKSDLKIVARNRKARHDFFIEEVIEAGIVLKGTEVKSIRQGRCNIKDAHAIIENSEVFLYNMHISPYEQGNRYNEDPLRKRKLLLNRREINKLIGYTAQKGYTLVPINVYIKNGLVKIELAIAKGKKLYDKRDTIVKKEVERKLQREFKERY
ncbi:SsrA-binding protein SmpB [Anaerosalibacter massiliensis]|nr:SsrA-binding protein SmpB [Anaerosalibacter massiliensis]